MCVRACVRALFRAGGSLVLLFLGIAKVNLSSAKEGVQAADQNPALGFMAVPWPCPVPLRHPACLPARPIDR
eukprot:SAG25_NODE_2740_length_1411_cov_0.828506_1_plen_72_part_00